MKDTQYALAVPRQHSLEVSYRSVLTDLVTSLFPHKALFCWGRVIPVADRCHAVGMAGCGHSKIARVRAYYLYCMCLAPAD